MKENGLGFHTLTGRLVQTADDAAAADIKILSAVNEAERAIAAISRNTTGYEIECGRATSAIRELREALFKAKE